MRPCVGWDVGMLAAALVVAASAAASGCTSHGDRPRVPSPAETALGAAVVRQYADIAHAAYMDAAAGAAALLAAVDRFRAAPSARGLEEARQSWLAARRPYLQTEVYRFYDGPIDRVEMLVNTWPIDENYVESTPGATEATQGTRPGIIDDTRDYPALSAELLSTLNAKEGETSISTGYHVIEFLLWGRDARADGPGDRPHTDYLVSGRRAALAQRRGTYLHLATGLLVQHLAAVAAAWEPARDDNYRAGLLRRAPREALGLIVKGMGALGGPELGGERLTVAFETRDQENEHSCFSDNTHDDIVLDALGIQNVCLGRYRRTDGGVVAGPGVCDWVALVDAALGERLKSDIAASVAAARAIPAPFDQAILGKDSAPGRRAIAATIKALARQTEALAEAAAAFGLAPSVGNADSARYAGSAANVSSVARVTSVAGR